MTRNVVLQIPCRYSVLPGRGGFLWQMVLNLGSVMQNKVMLFSPRVFATADEAQADIDNRMALEYGVVD